MSLFYRAVSRVAVPSLERDLQTALQHEMSALAKLCETAPLRPRLTPTTLVHTKETSFLSKHVWATHMTALRHTLRLQQRARSTLTRRAQQQGSPNQYLEEKHLGLLLLGKQVR